MIPWGFLEKNALFGVLGRCVVCRGSRQNDAILVVDSPINQGLTGVYRDRLVDGIQGTSDEEGNRESRGEAGDSFLFLVGTARSAI